MHQSRRREHISRDLRHVAILAMLAPYDPPPPSIGMHRMHDATAVRLLSTLAIAVLTCGVASAGPAAAQVRQLRLTSDNDAYLFWIPGEERPDYEYTSGVRAAVTVDGAPGWSGLAKVMGGAGDTSRDPAAGQAVFTTFELGHSIYTPRFDSSAPMPGQRPFAGFLSAGVTGTVVTGSVRQTVGVAVGVTGPPSLAEPVAKRIHAALGVYEPIGWKHQLKAEPGVILRYGIASELVAAHAEGRRVTDVTVDGGVTLGNVRTGAHGGVTGRVGTSVPEPLRPPVRGRTAVYLLAGARGEVVARDLFLDGNTFESDEPRVTRIPIVARVQGGVGVAHGGLSLEYRLTSRTRAYREEPGGHSVGTIEVAWRLPLIRP